MRDGSEVKDPRLGRLPSFDERSRKYNIAPLLEEEPRALKDRIWRVPYVLNQGNVGACVGFSWTHEAMTSPIMVPNLDNNDAFDVYYEARKIDEWEGEDYEGTSVLAGAKVMQQRGYFMEYRWAFNVEDALQALAYVGPIVIGIDWRDNMFDPTEDFYLDCGGDVAGGHAILVYGIEVDKDANPLHVLFHNSWGPGWGRYGNVKVRIDDFRMLLNERGEACIPVGRRYPE